MEAIIINSVKIIASVVVGVAVGKLASRFIIEINAGNTGKYALNKKNIKIKNE
jgi:hypothetical protein